MYFNLGKKEALSAISGLPLFLTMPLMKANVFPGVIFGKAYSAKKRQFDDAHDLSEFVRFAAGVIRTVPYYRQKYDFAAIKSIEDFKRIVCTIDKNDVLSVPDFFLGLNKACDSVTTGGTSGSPLRLLLPKTRYANELAALHGLWNKIGYNFSVRAVVRNESLKNRDFIVNPVTKEVIFDGFRSDEAYLGLIYRVMRDFRIAFFHGYTSNAERFANYLLSNGLSFDFLTGLITSSENFYEHQRLLFNRLNGVRHMNFYGHTEKLILGGWCESGGCYHFYSSYGFPELLDETGRDVCDVGAIGELVGSTNYNHCMPLLRYRTGDFAVKAPEFCPACGFNGLSVYRIYGRWAGDKVFNADGTFVSTTALNLHSHLYEHIAGLQYYQPARGVLEVRVVPVASYNDIVERELLDCIASKLAANSVVTVRRVQEVQRIKNGKYLLLMSDVK